DANRARTGTHQIDATDRRAGGHGDTAAPEQAVPPAADVDAVHTDVVRTTLRRHLDIEPVRRAVAGERRYQITTRPIRNHTHQRTVDVDVHRDRVGTVGIERPTRDMNCAETAGGDIDATDRRAAGNSHSTA